jgi:hypothetical protein
VADKQLWLVHLVPKDDSHNYIVSVLASSAHDAERRARIATGIGIAAVVTKVYRSGLAVVRSPRIAPEVMSARPPQLRP